KRDLRVSFSRHMDVPIEGMLRSGVRVLRDPRSQKTVKSLAVLICKTPDSGERPQKIRVLSV
ncbi:MAG: hypothetical protein Q8M58_12735, partial [Anaerolineales bacterium]|nr:hypothetical protein [Anaerolineales bacterium]